MFDLMHGNQKGLTRPELSIETMRANCPAAFAGRAAPSVSERYGHISTAQAIEIVRDMGGFYPVKAMQKPSRKFGTSQYNAHMIVFESDSLDHDGNRGTLTLYNSGDARSAAQVFSGVWRCLCDNGLMIGDGTFSGKLRHSKLTAANFNDLVRDTAANLPHVMDRIDRMKRVEIDPAGALEFAYDAASLRWQMDFEGRGERSGAYATDDTLHQINMVRRSGDGGSDLWRTFNRAQEAVVRGGVDLRSYTAKTGPSGADRKARPIGSIKDLKDVNQKLWAMADDILEAA